MQKSKNSLKIRVEALKCPLPIHCSSCKEHFSWKKKPLYNSICLDIVCLDCIESIKSESMKPLVTLTCPTCQARKTKNENFEFEIAWGVLDMINNVENGILESCNIFKQWVKNRKCLEAKDFHEAREGCLVCGIPNTNTLRNCC